MRARMSEQTMNREGGIFHTGGLSEILEFRCKDFVIFLVNAQGTPKNPSAFLSRC